MSQICSGDAPECRASQAVKDWFCYNLVSPAGLIIILLLEHSCYMRHHMQDNIIDMFGKSYSFGRMNMHVCGTSSVHLPQCLHGSIIHLICMRPDTRCAQELAHGVSHGIVAVLWVILCAVRLARVGSGACMTTSGPCLQARST